MNDFASGESDGPGTADKIFCWYDITKYFCLKEKYLCGKGAIKSWFYRYSNSLIKSFKMTCSISVWLTQNLKK